MSNPANCKNQRKMDTGCRQVRISSGHHHTVSPKSWSEGPGFWSLVTLGVSEGQALGRRVRVRVSVGEPAHLMALAGWGKEGLLRSTEPRFWQLQSPCGSRGSRWDSRKEQGYVPSSQPPGLSPRLPRGAPLWLGKRHPGLPQPIPLLD